LPETLVTFRATLEEIADGDLLVVDASSPQALAHIEFADKILSATLS